MRINKKTPFGQFYEEYLYHEDYLQLSKRRSLGIEPEMEAAKATINILKKSKIKINSILDVGCQTGHYLYSFRKSYNQNLYYTGVDGFSNHINAAKKIWKGDKNSQFIKSWAQKIKLKKKSDVSICINVFTHLPEINKSLKELNRLTNKICIIRTPIHNISYRIQQVYNRKWYRHSSVDPKFEFNLNGEPKSYNLFNVYSKEFFEYCIKKNFGNCKINFIKDTFFNPKKINKKTKKYLGTRVMNGLQVTDLMIVPNYFVVIIK